MREVQVRTPPRVEPADVAVWAAPPMATHSPSFALTVDIKERDSIEPSSLKRLTLRCDIQCHAALNQSRTDVKPIVSVHIARRGRDRRLIPVEMLERSFTGWDRPVRIKASRPSSTNTEKSPVPLCVE